MTELVVPPYIDALDGIAPRGGNWSSDPKLWNHSAGIWQRGSPSGETEARIKLRLYGAGDPISFGRPVQMVHVYDNSASMSGSDPGDLRCAGIKEFVDRGKNDTENGLVRLASTANLDHPLSVDRTSVKNSLQCSAQGNTNMHDALRLAIDELIAKKKSGSHSGVLLLTDGKWDTGGNPEPQVVRAVNSNIRIHSICLGSGCDEVELRDWGNRTYGWFRKVPNSSGLSRAYREFANIFRGDVVGMPPESGLPMVNFKLNPEFEVVPGSFFCDPGLCTRPEPDRPPAIQPGNKGLRLEWDAPVAELMLTEAWQIEFRIRSYAAGTQLMVNDLVQSHVEYDRADGSPGGSDVFEQLYVDVAPDPCQPSCLSRVEITPASATLLVGQQTGFSAAAYDQTGALMSGVNFTWGVNGSVGSVTQNGVFGATTAGNGTVWVSGIRGNITRVAEAAVTVKVQGSVPWVVSTDPADGSTGLALNATLTMRFSEAMDERATADAFSISPNAPGTLTFDFDRGSDGTSMHFIPSQDYSAGTTYTITISASAKSSLGVQMAQAYGFEFATASPPIPAPPSISHSPPPEAEGGSPLTVIATVTDDVSVKRVTLHYRSNVQGSYIALAMEVASGSVYSASVPGDEVVPEKIEYYIEAEDGSGMRSTSPPDAPGRVHQVEVTWKPAQHGPMPEDALGGIIAPLLLAAVLAVVAGALAAIAWRRRNRGTPPPSPPFGRASSGGLQPGR